MKSETPAPEWAKDLIIYEVATRGFTSPSGPESGTFRSLMGRLPYLADLGINAIWLTGHSWSDPRHFYNIWTQYACIQPDVLDPLLGTPQDFMDLIGAAHAHGIRVFLDVITHGVMSSSPLIPAHPEWFKGGSWGMTDYDWYGGHDDLDDWWVELWTKYVTTYGVDGYRLDVQIYRPDLWQRIKDACASADHPIVVWCEGRSYTGGASDFYQCYTSLAIQTIGLSEWHPLVNNVADWFAAQRRAPNAYTVQVEYSDATLNVGSSRVPDGSVTSPEAHAALAPLLHIDSTFNSNADMQKQPVLSGYLTTRVESAPPFDPTPPDGELPLVELVVGAIDPARQIARVVVADAFGGVWKLSGQTPSPLLLSEIAELKLAFRPQTPDWFYSSHQLSCHDYGWMTFPLDKNPYLAQGSRCLFGYSFMLVPSIPIMMSGEEFNADYIPLPAHSPNLFGGAHAGSGRWLYASMPDWSQLEIAEKRAFLEDTKRIISIRTAERDLLHASTNAPGDGPNILPLRVLDGSAAPVPYLIWNDARALLVAGNRSTEHDLQLTVALPLEQTALHSCHRFVVTDLWGGQPTALCSLETLQQFMLTIPKDKQPGGGLAVYTIVPSETS